MLPVAMITITLALVFYTIGVWSEKIQGELKLWHLFIFYLGLIFDTIGTTLMGRLSDDGFTLNFHSITGLLAIALMLIHALWATYVIYKKDDNAKKTFHKFSVIVWLIWLIPYVSGAMFGMAK
ncbi:MAG: HsmA family protein [Lachnospirales bacterium]